MRVLKWFVISLAVLILILVAVAYSLLDRSGGKVPTLKDHPNAYWSGAQDGGVFFEVTKANPPNYYIEVRYESGDIWSEGWVKYKGKGESQLFSKDLLGYDGGEDVYLQDGTALKLSPVMIK
ncbi:hypothetical protein NUH87_05935 [Pseudomonas batumici]|uniref:hypothetical protein n=1 Tax=Pseudomonas batumici TaxID=226910 RepID=UPI0030CD7298